MSLPPIIHPYKACIKDGEASHYWLSQNSVHEAKATVQMLICVNALKRSFSLLREYFFSCLIT